MASRAGPGDARTHGALTLFALARMERAGPVHGYKIAVEVEERTSGDWRPGPGAIYPALDRLVTRGLAQRRSVGRRKEYTITPAGRRLLREVRARAAPVGRNTTDLSSLWSEVMGAPDAGALLLVRLRNAIDRLELHLSRAAGPVARPERLRHEAVAELRRGATRLTGAGRRPMKPAGALR